VADSSVLYRKLPGRGSGVISIATLWESDTHLLLVTSWPSGETYRRFFYADIQALILRRTNQRFVINTVLGVIVVVASAPLVASMFVNSVELGWRVASGIVAGVCLFFILVNSLLGRTCNLHVQTPIQCERMPNVRRERQARKILARIQPLIEAAQSSSEAAPAQTSETP
jgi:hypothetical protein